MKKLIFIAVFVSLTGCSNEKVIKDNDSSYKALMLRYDSLIKDQQESLRRLSELKKTQIEIGKSIEATHEKVKRMVDSLKVNP